MYKRLLSIIMILLLIITSLQVNASSREIVFGKEQIKLLKDNFNNMSPEQKEIFIYEISNDKELINFHKEYIDTDNNFKTKNIKFFDINAHTSINLRSVDQNLVEQVRLGLKALNLPLPVYYSFVSFAGSLVAAIADGPLLVGDIVLLGSVVIGGIIVGWYWDSIKYKADAIVSVFRSAFGQIAGSAVSKMLNTASLSEEVDVSGNDGWTEVDGESDVLEDVNGEIGQCNKGGDGTIKKDVNDKDTGKKIGEIHMKQPQYGLNGGTNKVYTGKKFAKHFHDWANRLGKGKSQHWYWK